MREIRQSGSEGGGAETNRLSLPLLLEFLPVSAGWGIIGVSGCCTVGWNAGSPAAGAVWRTSLFRL